MSWLIFTVISVLSLSISIVLQRVILRDMKIPAVTYVVNFQLIVALLLLAFAATQGLEFPDYNELWPLVILCVTAFGVGHIFYAKTLQHIDASAFSIVFATHAVWVMLFGIVYYGESLALLQYLGSALIFVSIAIITTNWRSLRSNKGLLYGLVTGLFFGVAISSNGLIGREVEPINWAAWSFVGSTIVAALISPKKAFKIKEFVSVSLVFKFIVLGIFYAIGSVALLYAYIYGDFSIVSPLRQTGIVVTVLLALIFLKAERYRVGAKLLAAISATAGVILLLL